MRSLYDFAADLIHAAWLGILLAIDEAMDVFGGDE